MLKDFFRLFLMTSPCRIIKFTCRCGDKNHGAALKQHVKPLDDFYEREEYEKTMAVINWPKILLEPRRDRDHFGPDVETERIREVILA